MRHHLKCEAQFFDAIAEGRKTFEIRFNDREYGVDDELILARTDRSGNIDVGAKGLPVKVTYLTSAFQREGYVVMSIVPIRGILRGKEGIKK
jgi:ASC-1-like (ASCH) protein